MFAKLRRKWLYVRYWLNASNGKGHGIHSPFVFKLVKEVLNDTRSFYAFEQIANSKKVLLANNAVLKKDRQLLRETDQIKYGELLFKLVHFFSSQHILEIGNSIGITTAYMAAANEKAAVITLATDDRYVSVAREVFKAVQLHNITLVESDTNTTLQSALQKMEKVDLCYIHNYFAGDDFINYFNQLRPFLHEFSVLVIRPIRFDNETKQNWDTISNHSDVRLTIDLFEMGLIFFRTEQYEKQHFAIRF
ncbi:MAG: hypothetical protein K2X26_02590 [Chitinophagaceae bacterium]|nr:hypothetical protein [Chitinophagaceae bacterium]